MSPEDYRGRLHAARAAAGLSQRDLAERIGCSHSTVGQIETGARHLTAPTAFRWAAACGVSLDWIAWGSSLPEGQLLALEVTA